MWGLGRHKIIITVSTPGRNRIYPLGLMIYNVPGNLFVSQFCHNYESTPGTPLFCFVSHRCVLVILSLFIFSNTEIIKKKE